MACCAAPVAGRAAPKTAPTTGLMAGLVMRWSQNTWKENWLVIEKDIKVYTAAADFNKKQPRIHMELGAAKIQNDPTSGRRFTVDDGAMLVYFRCPEEANPKGEQFPTREFWVDCFAKATKNTHAHEDAHYAVKRVKTNSKRLMVVGEYMIGEMVGEGGYAKVKSGFHTKTGERVAAKIMPDKLDGGHQTEIMTMSAMKHQNIVELKDVLTCDGNIYLIMELAAGGELFAKLCDKGRFTEKDARFYWQQLLTGVLYCHKKGQCHRDLKLENLLLDKDGKVLKIADFGFAKAQDQSMPKTILGTAVYVAPEVLENHRYDGFKADIWSCGVILYTLLVGNYPFDLGYHGGVGPGNRRNPEIYRLLSAANYKLPSGCTRELVHMFSKIFEPNPDKRITTEQLLTHPWTVGPPQEGKTVADFQKIISSINTAIVYDKKVEAKLKELQQNQAKLKAGGQVDIGLYDGPSDGLGDGGDMLA